MRHFQSPKKRPFDGESVDPMLRWIWAEMQRQRVTQIQMRKMTGISEVSMRNWFQGRNQPHYHSVRAMVRALGHDLFAEAEPDGC